MLLGRVEATSSAKMPDMVPPPSKERFRQNPDDADALEVPEIANESTYGERNVACHTSRSLSGARFGISQLLFCGLS